MFEEEILSVSRLVNLLQEVVEDNFVQVSVVGEISNFAAPSSGHFYFSLKDERCQLKAVMFRQHNRLLGNPPENGQQVICRGRLSVYPQRGELQMVVEHLELQGEGGLQAEFERLRKQLQQEGLFAEERKRELPAFPRKVGVVTSSTGAAIHDILQVLKRRAAGVEVVLWPVRVQGDEATAEIVRAIEGLNRHNAADVLIVGRGGGSLEDLWSFNEEPVARAIFASHIPVISAVGHEVDVTIADMVADRRAPTPSAAAEIVARSSQEMETHLDHLQRRMETSLQTFLARFSERVEVLSRRLRSPQQVLEEVSQRLAAQEERLQLFMQHVVERKTASLNQAMASLEAYSPQRTLERGFSIVTDSTGQKVLSNSAQVQSGEKVAIRFAKGSSTATVDEVES